MPKNIVFKKPATAPLPVTIPEDTTPKELVFPDKGEQARNSFTPEVVGDLLKSIQLGLTLADASGLVKLKPSMVQGWYNRNYCNFKFAVDEVRAKNKRLHIARVQGGQKAWQSSAWWLERKHKQEFSKEITVTVNHVLIDNVSKVMADALFEFIKDVEQLQRAKEFVYSKLLSIKEEEFPVQVIGDQ